MELIQQAEVIYRKNNALEKVMELLGELQAALQAQLVTGAFSFAEAGGKISRGERYKELPWLMLDYPRYFSKESIFACRTMFWWGHYFIFTLHLSGEMKEQYEQVITAAWAELGIWNFRIYTAEDPWEHDFENGHYIPVAGMPEQEFKRLVNRSSFIKLAKPYQLEEWENIITGVVTDYVLLLQLMAGHKI